MLPLAERFHAIAFDLDGTLVDTAPDLAAAANAMLKWLGHAPLPESDIAALIGHGIERLVGDALARSTGAVADPAALSRAVTLFRDYYGERLFVQSRVYPGVLEALKALRAHEVPACCITNKPSAFALRLLEAAGLAAYLRFALCADRVEERKPSPRLLLVASTRLGVAPHELLYVGDSRSDVEAARAAGCPVALVEYGYRRSVRLADMGADWVVGSLAQLLAAPAVRPLESNVA
jgi:phosphoglycolate phosphatase